MEDLMPIDELRQIVRNENKSITDLSATDIKLHLDTTKTMEEQAEDVVSAMATARAVSNEDTAKELTEKKAEELKARASAKEKKAETENLIAQTEQQKAERDRYEAVLETFGIYKHLPSWLMKVLVFIFSPIYVFFNLVIGLPCGLVKILIINIDGIFTRYDDADDRRKPKIRLTVWILLSLIVLALTAFV
jgi:hypothetical protein